jgi:uncharacterized lipoprotein
MRPTVLIQRLAIVALATILVSGCHWFRKDKGVYAQSPETRPLEVPPDLDLPNTENAAKMPALASTTAPSAPVGAAVGSAIGFTVAGTRDDIFNKVGTALAGVEGLTVASRAQVLGAYDVNYMGANFLVRITAVEAGVYVSAVDPRGLPAAGEGPTKLIATLKTALGG